MRWRRAVARHVGKGTIGQSVWQSEVARDEARSEAEGILQMLEDSKEDDDFNFSKEQVQEQEQEQEEEVCLKMIFLFPRTMNRRFIWKRIWRKLPKLHRSNATHEMPRRQCPGLCGACPRGAGIPCHSIPWRTSQ
eukprot:symbB.v1.2.026763.t1/scaffold2701.1/size72746/1